MIFPAASVWAADAKKGDTVTDGAFHLDKFQPGQTVTIGGVDFKV